jgi:hypothetical protein
VAAAARSVNLVDDLDERDRSGTIPRHSSASVAGMTVRMDVANRIELSRSTYE